ncbi:hypothetical protein Tco_1119461 [Tanacetum coccineum]
MESVFHICNYDGNYQAKYATCTLLDSALTWWNSYVKTIGLDTAYKKLEWKLALLCPTMVTPEYKMTERYIWGLTDDIQGNVTSSKPKRTGEAIRMAHDPISSFEGKGY